ncbi:CDP-alcohol phosphatidyltransferase family protein [Candidatus Woesearchaeota archaeon]|nr:CDP-alcohol phosphatidyltransferase family protein [Candidatus Woesearchaeota archaeon]
MKPNLLTTIRFISLFLVIAADWAQFHYLALIFLFFGFCTDYLDGLVARKYKKGSEIGIYYDHFVDKIFVHLLLIYYLSQNLLGFWVVALLILRDYLALGFRQYALSQQTNIASVQSGKIKLVAQGMLLMFIALGRILPFSTTIVEKTSFIVVVWSFGSLVDMGWKNKSIFKKLWKEL